MEQLETLGGLALLAGITLIIMGVVKTRNEMKSLGPEALEAMTYQERKAAKKKTDGRKFWIWGWVLFGAAIVLAIVLPNEPEDIASRVEQDASAIVSEQVGLSDQPTAPEVAVPEIEDVDRASSVAQDTPPAAELSAKDGYTEDDVGQRTYRHPGVQRVYQLVLSLGIGSCGAHIFEGLADYAERMLPSSRSTREQNNWASSIPVFRAQQEQMGSLTRETFGTLTSLKDQYDGTLKEFIPAVQSTVNGRPARQRLRNACHPIGPEWIESGAVRPENLNAIQNLIPAQALLQALNAANEIMDDIPAERYPRAVKE